MQPIMFCLNRLRLNLNGTGLRRGGVPPPIWGTLPLPATKLRITGITKDSAGVVLPNCAVTLYRTADDMVFEEVISDANGAFSFSAIGLSETYYVVAYLPGSPDVAGTTLNTLVGV